jgi:hypothetical protein
MRWFKKREGKQPVRKLERTYHGPLPTLGEDSDSRELVYTITQVQAPDTIVSVERIYDYGRLLRYIKKHVVKGEKIAPWPIPESGERCMACGVYLPQGERGPQIIELMIARERQTEHSVRLEDVAERPFCCWSHLASIVQAAQTPQQLHAMCVITPPGAMFR